MCSICKQLDCPPGCPNYVEPNSNMYCEVCGNAILAGQEYAINCQGEYAHDFCVGGYFELAEFAGVHFDAKELENYDDIF